MISSSCISYVHLCAVKQIHSVCTYRTFGRSADMHASNRDFVSNKETSRFSQVLTIPNKLHRCTSRHRDWCIDPADHAGRFTDCCKVVNRGMPCKM